MKTIVLAAGGTGGHINPALRIADEFRRNNWHVCYCGNVNSLEEKLAKEAGYPFYGMDVQKIYRKFTFAHLKFPFRLYKSIMLAKRYFSELVPDVFLGTGGFVAGPPLIAAKSLKIPVFWQEQNTYAGLTTRLAANYALRIYCGFPQVGNLRKNCVYSGNPVEIKASENLSSLQKKYDVNPRKKTILFLGGSQGSLALNDVFEKCVEYLAKNYNIFWQAGEKNLPRLQKYETKNLRIFGFTNNLEDYYSLADVAVARAGALTLAELESYKIPALFIPLPTAAANHQYLNAMYFVAKGTGKIIEQSKLNRQNLIDGIEEMLKNLSTFNGNFTESLHKEATKFIYNDIVKLLGEQA